jgi:CubicO group peptidase (beta-lactamase class C family)
VSVPASASASAGVALTSSDLSAFLDGYVPVEMDRAGVAGLAVAVVADGHVVLARGYGSADRARRVPVSAERTLFRIGSISKLFAWTAVMQLVEQHRLDLDADVQRYVDFPLPAGPGRPVTMRDLMTHAAGYEETVRGMWAVDGEPADDLRGYLVAHAPARIFPAGRVVAYSNWGATLAGYVVQRVSGEPFARYVDRHVLQPLGMARTSFAQPLPAAIAGDASAGYAEAADPAKGFETIRVAPAGAASSSAADMARFMIAELGDGSVDGGARILRPETIAQMQAPQFRPAPQVPAMGLGFWQDGGFDERVVGHGGDTQWFHSGLYLLPGRHVGVFVSQNSAGRRALRDELMRRFMARYFPDAPAAVPAGRPPASETDGLPGRYIDSRRNESGALALATLTSQTSIAIDDAGTMTVGGAKGLDDRPVRLRWRGPGTWQDERDPARRLFFWRDAGGRWNYAGHVPVVVGQRVEGWRDARVFDGVLFAALGTMALTLAAWPVAALVRRHFRRRHGLAIALPPAQRRARVALRWAALLTLLPWLALLAPPLAGMDAFQLVMKPEVVALLRVVQAAAWAGPAAVALAAWAAALRFSPAGGRPARWTSKAHALACLLAAAGGVLAAWQGHLMTGIERF